TWRCRAVSADGRCAGSSGWPSSITAITSAGVSAPLSRPEIVTAAVSSSMRIEKLLLVAGVQPRAASSAPAFAISVPQACRRSASCAGVSDMSVTAIIQAAECSTCPVPKNDAIGAAWAYHACSARLSSVDKEYGDDRRNCIAAPPLPQTCWWRRCRDGSAGFTDAPRVGGVAALERHNQCHGESTQVRRGRYQGRSAAQAGSGLLEVRSLLGQTRRSLRSVRDLPGLRRQREGLVHGIPGKKLISAHSRGVANVRDATVMLLAVNIGQGKGWRRQVAARIRQAEELTTPAAPGNGPGSTANGKFPRSTHHSAGIGGGQG